jgi:NitT/TauT family transport system permease protein
MAAVMTRVASVLAFLLIWEAAARLIGNRLLPGASTVGLSLVREIQSGVLPYHLAITLGRVIIAFVLSMLVGTALGLAMGRSRWIDLSLGAWLTALLNVPALVVIVLLYVWFGLTEAAAIAAVALNKLPNTAVVIREGARALDAELHDMARSFHIGGWRRLRHITLPQLAPYFLAASRSGLALIWKIVLVVEILGRSNGVGFEIQMFFQLFDVTRILAYSMAFIIVMQVIEWVVFLPLERSIGRWRR